MFGGLADSETAAFHQGLRVVYNGQKKLFKMV